MWKLVELLIYVVDNDTYSNQTQLDGQVFVIPSEGLLPSSHPPCVWEGLVYSTGRQCYYLHNRWYAAQDGFSLPFSHFMIW